MKKLFHNRIIKNYLLMLITLFAVELIFRAVLKMPLIDWSLLRIFIGINIVTMILSIIFSYCGRIGSNILTFLFCLLGTIYATLQAGFYNFLGVFVSVETSSQLGAVKDYITDYFDSFKNSFYLILIPFGFLIIYYILFERKVKLLIKNQNVDFVEKFNTKELKEKEAINRKNNRINTLKNTRINFIIIIMLLCGVYYYSLDASFMKNELQLRTTKNLFLYPDIPNLAVAQFGSTGFGLIDIETLLFPRKITQDDEFIPYVKKELKDEDITDYTRIIDDSSWEEWDNETNNNDYKKLNSYYMSREITPKNDFTGLFEGKNLIVIMMESANTILLDEKYYPNVSKLAKEGWNFTNAYSPRNSCNTGNNEMSGMVSLYTINRTCTANIYKDNIYPQSIFNLFNNKGYKTSSFHNYTEAYYRRKTIHQNMGSTYYGVESLGIPYTNKYEEWPSDIYLVEEAMKRINTNEPFMTWFTTVSSHQPYGVSSELGDLNLKMFKDTNYDITLQRYMSKLKVLDDAIGKLLEILQEKDILDDTVIVLYGDHYPYGIKNHILNQYFDYDVNEKFEVDRTPFIIYNKEITPTTYDQYTTFMNIVPTMANLFNLDYDPRLYAGRDVLSETYPNRVVFADGSWQDNVAFYSATTGNVSYYGEKEYDNEYIINVNKEISDMIKMSNTAITTNYFKELVDGSQKYETNIKEDIPVVVPPTTNSSDKKENDKES